jgi:hypothetical protein
MAKSVINMDNIIPVGNYGSRDIIEDFLVDDDTRVKYYRRLEVAIRGSFEYKNFLQFLKKECDMSTCSILGSIKSGEWVTVELHHHPFTLMDVVDAVHRKREALNESLSSMAIIKEVVEVHYKNWVGLVPLSTTMHELYHNGKLELDLRSVFGDIRAFALFYGKYMDKRLAAKVRRMVKLANENLVNEKNEGILSVRSNLISVEGSGTMAEFLLED